MTEKAPPAGRPPAESGARSPAAGRALNAVVRGDGEAAAGQPPSTQVPASVRRRYLQDGRAFRAADRQDRIAFVDRGDRLHAYSPVSPQTMRALAEIAEHRGWKAVEVSGADPFRQGVYLEAAARRVQVSGYAPTPRDAALLQQYAQRQEAMRNPVVKAYLEANSVQAREAAARRYPQLQQAFNETRKAEAVAGSIGSRQAAATFVGRFKEAMAVALHNGRAPPRIAGVEADTGKANAAAKAGERSPAGRGPERGPERSR